MDAFIKSYIEDRAQEELIEIIKKAQKERAKKRMRVNPDSIRVFKKFNLPEHLTTLQQDELTSLLNATDIALDHATNKLVEQADPRLQRRLHQISKITLNRELIKTELKKREEKPVIVIHKIYNQNSENKVQGFLDEQGGKSFEGYVYDYEVTYKSETKRGFLNTEKLLTLTELQDLITFFLTRESQ